MATIASRSARRRQDRQRVTGTCVFRISVEDSPGRPRWLTADVVDHSSSGLGIALAIPLQAGTLVVARGRLDNARREEILVRARVAWCLERPDGSFRAGLEYELGEKRDPFKNWTVPEPDVEDLGNDYYEILQLSSGADPETVHRVYRMLAQRYHPDNAETGDEATFKRVLRAYQVLRDPEQRAAYDVRRIARRQGRWRIFDQRQASAGVGSERRKRQGVLSLLYTQRVNEPETPFLTIHELEELLGCPRDHLQVSLWYLRERNLISRSDSGQYSITVTGFEEAEETGTWLPDADRLLPPGTHSETGS